MGVAAAGLMSCAIFLMVMGFHMPRITSGIMGFLAAGMVLLRERESVCVCVCGDVCFRNVNGYYARSLYLDRFG